MSKDALEDLNKLMADIESLNLDAGDSAPKSSASSTSEPAVKVNPRQDEVDELMEEVNRLVDSEPDAASEPAVEAEPVAETESGAETEDDALAEMRAGGGGAVASDEPSMEETLGTIQGEEPAAGGALAEAMSTEDVEETVSEKEEVSVADRKHLRVVTEPSAVESAAAPGTLNLTLSGQMNLRLSYETGGQSVTLAFEEGCLKVLLAGGVEFRVPMEAATTQARKTG